MAKPKNKEKQLNLRALAALAITPVLKQQGAIGQDYEQSLAQLNKQDRGLFQQLCLGSLRQYFELEALVSSLLSKPLKPKDSDIQALLLIGIYQLRHLRVPDHAAISETVDASKQLNKLWASKMINGVLRNYQRKQESLEEELSANESFLHAHPSWLIGKLKKAWPNLWPKILDANKQQGPLTLRINARPISREEYTQQLRDAELDHQVCDHAIHGLRLNSSIDITSLPGYEQGEFSVQDEAAQLSASLLDIQPNQHVLDACCAPGGKTCHIAESEPKLSSLTAVELESHRMKRVEENLERLGLSAKLIVSDVLDLEKWWNGQAFDRILLDAPCSATGVIRRHPDIKILRRPSDLTALSKLQANMLEKLWPLLKTGGKLLYATCSVLPEENSRQIATFVEHHADAIHLPIDASWGEQQNFGRQLFPQTDGHDGFYYALLEKRE